MKATREMFALRAIPTVFDEANRRAFERACHDDGIDPARGVSPSLLRKLGAMPSERRDEEAA